MPSVAELQHTLGKSAALSGTSLHTGAKVSLKIQPGPVDSGIKFKRIDLQDEPTIDATIANVKTVERATTIGEGSIRVHTVEHVLSALSALGVDNAVVEMDANEPPIGDGSAQAYVEAIRKAGVVPQEAPRARLSCARTDVDRDQKRFDADRFAGRRIPHLLHSVRSRRTFHPVSFTPITPATYEREIAPARTFVYYEDVQPLMEKNLIKGGSLENAIVVRGESVLSKEPLRFPDEFVRHKILDIIGDLALFGRAHSWPRDRGQTRPWRKHRTGPRAREGA